MDDVKLPRYHDWYTFDHYHILRNCLVGGVEKWEDKKYFNFSHFCLDRSTKVGGWKK